MPDLRSKVDLIHFLSGTFGYRRYLELCTSTTGGFFASIDRTRFDVCHRLMYRCPDGFDDGQRIDFRSPTSDIAGCLAEMRSRGLRYDIALLDPWHEYDASRRDIEAGLRLLVAGGTAVVHDCLPPSERIASATFIDGEWCGVTYQAFLDTVTSRRGLEYCTVDTDYGCGIIRKVTDDSPLMRWVRDMLPGISRRFDRAAPESPRSPQSSQSLTDEWRALSAAGAPTYAFFEQHKAALLKLRSVDEFVSATNVRSGRSSPGR